LASFEKDYTGMHSQQNIRFEFVQSAKLSSPIFPSLYGYAVPVQLIIFGECLTGFKTKIHGCNTKRAGRFGYRVRNAVMIYMEPAQTQLPSEQRIDGTWLTPALAPDKKNPLFQPVK